jgi:hypothetical protein
MNISIVCFCGGIFFVEPSESKEHVMKCSGCHHKIKVVEKPLDNGAD